MDAPLHQQILSDVMNAGLSILGVAVSVLVGFIATKFRSWLSERATEAKQGKFGEAVEQAVRYAEQYGITEKMKAYAEKAGPELASYLGDISKKKMQEAKKHLGLRMNSFGLKVEDFPDEMISNSIEAEVKKLFSSTPTAENYSVWEAAVNRAAENGVIEAEKVGRLKGLKGDEKKTEARKVALDYLGSTGFKIANSALDAVIERTLERYFPKTSPATGIS